MASGKLYYIFDPLCGWCYGFSDVIKKIATEYQDQLDIEVLSGGMVLGDRVKPLSAMHDYLKEAMPRLEEMTGKKFGEAYLKEFEKGTMVLSSEKPCIAMTVYKSMKATDHVRFASALQHALYEKGMDMQEDKPYQLLAEEFDLPWEVFESKLKSEDYKKRTYEEFGFVQRIGIQGFPSVLLQQEEQAYLLARGYQPYAQLHDTIEKILKGELKSN